MRTTRAALAVLGLILASAPAFPQTPTPTEPAQREMQVVQDLLVRASAEFDGPQQSRSIALYDQIIETLEGLRRGGTLPPRGREILAQAYEYRARAYYNIGLQEKASDSFRSLIQLQPQYALSKDRVSPKVVEFFNSVKKALVGYLAVSSKPPGARVTLNGEFLSLTDFFPLEVLAGEYTVEVSRDGYQTETRNVSIAPKATETLQVDMVRTQASYFFQTEPAGVEIWVDGQLRTTTAGAPTPEMVDELRGRGLDPARTSGRTEVGNLVPGSHTVEFRKPCYEPVRNALEIPEAKDYFAEPLRLEDSLSTLQLESDPPGAKIYIDGKDRGADGKEYGLTPRELDGLCSGRHRVEVKHASGKFVQDVVLARNEGLTLKCPIRPSVAFLGVVAASPAGERVAPEAEEKLAQNLAKLTTLNFLPAPRDVVDRALRTAGLAHKDLVPGGADPEALRNLTKTLASDLEVQGFLIAVLPEERLQRTAVLHLLAAGNTVADRWEVSFAEPASYLRFLSAVDQKATVYRPWSGLITVDTSLHDGVPVLRVAAGSPAAQAGVQAGDVLFAVDGHPVKATADLLRAIDAKKPKDRLSLQLRGASGERAVDLTLGQTPQEVPLNDQALLYNKVMMDLQQEASGRPGSEEAAFAHLNLALCAMHFGDFNEAYTYLQEASKELPQRPGISQGTAAYYLGLSYERMGDRKRAAEAYRSAASFKEATLYNNDGPLVASLAAQRAN
jgi:tetratricopeptide (TPR) repeat protein